MELSSAANNKTAIPEFLSRGGEMGERIRSFDWSTTSLGEVEKWPQSLKSAVSICLNSNFPIAIYWGKELVLLYNDAWSPIPGNKHPWALGHSAKEVWPEIWNDIEPQFQKAFNGEPGGSKDALLPMQRHGYVEECYFDFTFTPVYGEAGKVEGIFNAVIETTKTILNERRQQTLRDLSNLEKISKNIDDVYKAAAKALEKNNKDFPFVIVYKINDDGTQASPIAYAGIEEHQKTFPTFIDITKPVEGSYNFCKAFATNQIFVSENNGRRKNIPKGGWDKEATHFIHLPITNQGRKYPYAILSAALNPYRKFDESYQQFTQLVADQIATEVNNVLVIEEERKRAAALAEIDKAKTVFFSNISHEFRTPLTLILGSLEELLQKKNGEGNLETIETTHRNAMRLLRLVNKLLDFSRIEAGRVQAEFQVTDIANYTKDLAASFRSVIENAGLSFVVSTKAIEQPVYIDKEMWEKIVFNLLSNAFKYTLEGSISLLLEMSDNKVLLKVKDTGVGIPKEELPKMFQRFHRVQNVVGRTYEGTGIGLSLVNELVKMHGGEISVNSTEGKGTEFIVSIPTGKQHLPTEQVLERENRFSPELADVFVEEASSLTRLPASENGKETPKSNTETATVLVVDDNDDMRLHIKKLLQKQYNVITSNNGEDALQQIKKYAPDLVVSDIMMPVIDGIQLLKTLKGDHETENIPVILLSARAGQEAKIEGYETGADDYLIKPFSAKELLARVTANIKIVKSRQTAENKLRNIIMQSPVAMTVLRGPSHIIEVANDRALELWGRSYKDVRNLPLTRAMPELIDQGFEKILDEVYLTGKPFIGNEFAVTMLRHGKLETIYINFIFEPLRNDNEEIEGIVGIGIDVSEQVEARKKVKESEVRYHNLIYSSPSAIAILKGKDFIVSVANDAIIETWGKGRDIIGKPLLSIMPEVVEQGFKDLLTDVYTTGEPYYGHETPVQLLRNGKWETVFYNFVYQAIRDTDGTVEGLAIIANEVTPQALFHKKIEENEEQLRIALEAGELGTYDFRPQTGELLWSDRTRELFGLPDNEEISLDAFFKSLHPEDRERSDAAVKKAMQPGNGLYENEYRTFDKTDGKMRWIRSKGKVIFDTDGTPIRFTGVTQDISRQKEMLRSLGYASTLFQNIIDAVIGTDMEYKITSWNKGAEILYGYKEEEVLGKLAREIIPTEFPTEKDRLLWLEALETKGQWQGEVRQKRKDGSPVNILASIAYVKNEDGEMLGAVAVNKNITDRKLIEQDLKNAKDQLELTFKNIPAGVYLIDRSGQLIYVNERGASVYGDFTPEELLAEKDLVTLLKRADELFERYNESGGQFASQHSPAFISLTTGRASQAILKQVNRQTGEVRWHYVQGAPLFDKDEKVFMVLVTSTDITAQKKAEENIRESEEKFRTLAETLPQLIWITDAGGLQEYASKRWNEYTGIEPKDEKSWKQMVHPHDIESITTAWTHSIHTGAPYHAEVRLKNKNGEYQWHFAQGEPIKTEEGKILKWIGSFTNIHDQKTISEKLENLVADRTKALERSNDDLQQFAHVASHDLKEPVRKVKTFSSRLRHEFGDQLPDKAKTYMEKMDKAADRMYTMIDGVLFYSSFSAMEQVSEKVDLNEIIKNIEADLEIVIHQKKAVINFQKLPVIEGSPILMHQLFYNLINNSLKFSKDEVPPLIEISSSKLNASGKIKPFPRGEFVQIFIKDNGIGFNQSNASKIFKTFSRLNSKDKYEGTGLGLSLCKKIVERHGGIIEAEGKENEGSAFKIILPLKQDIQH